MIGTVNPNRGPVGRRPDSPGIRWSDPTLPTYRQVDWWIRTGAIPGDTPGSGVYRTWTEDDLARLRCIRRVYDAFKVLGINNAMTTDLVARLWAAADRGYPPIVVGPVTIATAP